MKTWVHCTDEYMKEGGEKARHDNYGLVVGRNGEKLQVAFANKHVIDDEGNIKRALRNVNVSDLSPVPGRYQMTDAEMQALFDSEPVQIDRAEMPTAADQAERSSWYNKIKESDASFLGC